MSKLDQHAEEVRALHSAGLSYTEIGRRFGVHRTSVQRFLDKSGRVAPTPSYPDKDLIDVPVDRLEVDGTCELVTRERPATVEELIEKCQIDTSRWVVTHFKCGEWQSFYRNKARDGHTVVPLFKAQATFKRILGDQLEKALLEFVRENVEPLPPPKRVMKRTNSETDFLTVWGIWDAHVGMYAWSDEVGQSFDLNIARNRVMNSIDDMVDELKQYEHRRIVMPIGNDFMHFDNARMTTLKSDHFLDYDGRFAKVFKVALECLVYQVQRALDLCDDVQVLWIPGNHDYSSSFGLVAAVEQRFLENPFVTVDLGANPRKYVRYGGCLLGFDHGQKCTPAQLARIMSEEQIDYWSRSTYREVQIGHRHQRWLKEFPGVIPTNGVTIRMNPALCNVDLWHHEQGLIGEPVKSVEAYRYDTTGYRGSHNVWARDEDRSRH